jgi:hypothetical protein
VFELVEKLAHAVEAPPRPLRQLLVDLGERQVDRRGHLSRFVVKLTRDSPGFLLPNVEGSHREEAKLVAAREHLTVEREVSLLTLLESSFDPRPPADVAERPRESDPVVHRDLCSRQRGVARFARNRLKADPQLLDSGSARTAERRQP